MTSERRDGTHASDNSGRKSFRSFTGCYANTVENSYDRQYESPARQSRLDRPQEKSVSPGWRRRRFLCTAGGVAVAGLFTGCLNDSSTNTEPDDESEGASVDEWLADTDNYNGSVTSITGKTSVTVKVGAEGNNGSNAFAPVAIEVSPGTTVTWKWVNGYHNVVATDGQFNSGQPEQNATFEHTFEAIGTVLYYCEPHKSLGMKGAVIVAGGEGSENTATQSEAQ